MEGMKNIPDKSIDLIVTDPPYYKVMLNTWDGKSVAWDNQWKTLDDYRSWFKEILSELDRVLKNNGSLYLFTDNLVGAYVQTDISERFNVLNRIEWVKTNSMNLKYWENINKYADCNESIIFAEKLSSSGRPATGLQQIFSTSECFNSIKEYMRSERDKLMSDKGMTTISEFNDFINNWTNTKGIVSRHYFADSQYCFPTRKLYEKMQETGYWQRPYDGSLKEYEGLRQEYEGLRQEYERLRRPFHPPKNYTNVWKTKITTSIEGGTIHPTQKPVQIIERMLNTSSDKGMTVLDPFMGSGTTAIAAIRNNRHFIGFELDPDYYKQACERVDAEIMHEKTKTSILDCW